MPHAHRQADKELLSPEETKQAAEKLAIPEADVKYLVQELFMTYVSVISAGVKSYEAGEKVDLGQLDQLLDRRIGYLEHGFKKAE